MRCSVCLQQDRKGTDVVLVHWSAVLCFACFSSSFPVHCYPLPFSYLGSKHGKPIVVVKQIIHMKLHPDNATMCCSSREVMFARIMACSLKPTNQLSCWAPNYQLPVY